MARESLYPESVKVGKPILSDLPPGWERSSLNNFLKIENRQAVLKDDQEYDLVIVKRSRGGVIRRAHLRGRDISVKSQFYIKEGDFLISKRQIVHGACGIVPKMLAGSIVSNEYSVLSGKPNFYLPYIEYLSESLYFQQTCFHSSIGVHIEKMIFKLESWFKWPFNIPPLLEQKKITQILSTWDKAITTNEKLLANCVQQKKALMQQLLSGKKRFPRFSEEWIRIKLKQCIKLIGGYAFKSELFVNFGIPIIRISNIKNDFSVDIGNCVYYLEDKIYDKFKVYKGDIVIAMSGATTGKVGRCYEDAFCYLNQRVGKFEINKVKIHPDFLFQLLKLPYVQNEIMIDAIGGAQPNISNEDIEKIRIPLPSLEEQQQIASMLAKTDREIEILQQKINCLKQEKKALMQQLLTGKRRVQVNEMNKHIREYE